MNELTYKPLTANNTDAKTETETNVYIPAEVQKKKKVSTLYVTDLPFTANRAIKANLPVVGYHGICDQHSDTLHTLEPDFVQLLQKKKIHTVVLLLNSDTVDPYFSPGEEKDLSKPLFNIFYAVKRFRDQLNSFDPDITLIYSNLKHHLFHEGLKTIDDVGEKHPKLFKSIANYRAKSNAFLDSINITELSVNRLFNHLKLKNVNDFYSYHSDWLKYYEFTFKSVSWSHDGDKLEKLAYSDAKLYLRVGPFFYKRIMMVNAHDEYEEVLKTWRVGEIGRDYGAEFVRQIAKFDSFTNRPSNNGEYQRTITTNHNGIISSLYNLYHPVDWDPIAGEWPTIKKFLEHIFSACNIYSEIMYEWGLDYLQLSYLFPRQRLPILALVSEDRNTGKSTFLDFLKLIYGANMAILDNQRFNPKFTSHFAGKLFVGVDEGHIPLHDKTTKEMIKNTATGKTMWLEAKGTNAESVDNFTHLIFCSNDERNFMQIDAGENRFAVFKVPSFRNAGVKDDPDMLDKMRAEVPAFLNFLINRRLHYPDKTTRFWFPDKVYVTEAFQAVVDKTKSSIEKELEDWINDSFLDFDVAELNYTLSEITTEVSRAAETKFPKNKIKDLLAEKYGVCPGPSLRYSFYSRDEIGETKTMHKKGRFCTFFRKDWVKEEEPVNLVVNGTPVYNIPESKISENSKN
jgi:hypothetical protein